MITNCPICRRMIVIHWPQHWVYRRGPSYYCGDQCMTVAIVKDQKLLNAAKRIRSARKMNGKITLEMKKKAAEIAISGGSPLKYLKECGAKNPSASWQYIRKTLEKTDPDTFAKLPDKLPKISQETPDTVPTVKVDGPLRIETKEADRVEVVKTPVLPEVLQPAMIDGMLVREVSGIFGRYRYTDSTSAVYIDFEAPDNMDVLSLTVEQWQKFREEQVKAAKILGVKL